MSDQLSGTDQPAVAEQTGPSLRLDKWLWYARFFKSRSLATQLCNAGKLRLGSELVKKAHQTVRPGDVLTFPQARQIRVVKILALASRRGPASEAQMLYEDLAPPDATTRQPKGTQPPVARRDAGAGRPTKQHRRAVDRLKGDL